MKDFAKSIHVGNKEVGNALKYTNLEEAKKMCQQMNDSLAPDAALRHFRHVYEKDGVYYVMETGEAVAKGMKRVGNSKVGNAKWSILEVTNPNTPNDGKYVGTIEADTKYEAESKFKKENPNIENRVVAVKVKNASVEEQNEKLFHSLKKDVEEKEEDNNEKIEEVGNASSFVESAKRHIGENKTKADAEYWQYVIDKLKMDDPEEKAFVVVAKRELEKTKANLSKVGNATYDMTERDYENEYKSLVQKRNNLQTGTKEYEEVQKKLAEIRKKIGRSPFGNSASDDKFAYVMREFDEGKLKTPDGKVVTSPEQAKAIAYSESKKAENGLARARNAMACNKKVGNWNSERTIDPVGKYPAFLKNLKNAIDLGVAAVNYNSIDEATLKAWVEQAKKEGYGAHIDGVQGHKVTLK